jgi:hypothetical protein
MAEGVPRTIVCMACPERRRIPSPFPLSRASGPHAHPFARNPSPHHQQTLAREGGHAQLTAAHIALALLEDQDGIARQVSWFWIRLWVE